MLPKVTQWQVSISAEMFIYKTRLKTHVQRGRLQLREQLKVPYLPEFI